MAEYIERDIFINNKLIPLVKQLDLLHPKQKKGVLMAIKELNNEPTADVVEVKHGEWICLEQEIGLYECSLCNHKMLRSKSNFCPNCSAKMDKRSDAQ